MAASTRSIERSTVPSSILYPESTANVAIFSFQNGELICANQSCRNTTVEKAHQIYEIVQKVNQFFLKKFGVQGLNGLGKTAPIFIS